MAADFTAVAICVLVASQAVSLSHTQTVDQFTQDTGIEGTSERLFCRVADRGLYSVFWYVETDQLFLNVDSADYATNRPKYHLEEDIASGYYNLTINDLTMSDAGLYECLLSDGVHTVNGHPGLLEVVPPVAPPGDPTCLARYPEEPLTEGDEISASCVTAEGGRPNSKLEWYGARGQIGPNGYGPNHTVTWKVSLIDNGEVFTCQEDHLALNGYHRSCTIGPLTVLYSPLVTITPANAQSKVGDKITLTCTGSANPSIRSIRWIIENETLTIPMVNASVNSTDSRFIIEDVRDVNGSLLSSRLEITAVREEDYTTTIMCVAESVDASGNATVTVSPPDPVFVYDYGDINTIARNPLLLLAVDLSAIGGLAVIGLLFLIAPHLGCLVSESYRQKRRDKQQEKQFKREIKLQEKERHLSAKRERNLVPIAFGDTELEMYDDQTMVRGSRDASINANNTAEEDDVGKASTSSNHSRSTSLSRVSNCVVEIDDTIYEVQSL